LPGLSGPGGEPDRRVIDMPREVGTMTAWSPIPDESVMATTSVHEPPIEQAGEFTWRAHPARQRPVAALFAAGVIVGIGAACAVAMNAWWGILAVAVLVLTLYRFFFPSRFTLDAQGVTARYLFGTTRCGWSEIRRFCHDRHGVYLSTRSRPSRLDAFRGIHLLFGRSREEVLRRIRLHLADGGSTTCGG